MTQRYLEYAEFYITNYCNFNCTGCNRFNNYNFQGHQHWDQHRDIYAAWAQRLDIGKICILGGEPMANPSYLDWISGLHALWPQAKKIFLTNGSLLKTNNHEFYDLCLSLKDNLRVSIGLHNKSRREQILSTLQQWMENPIEISYSPGVATDDDLASQRKWVISYQTIKDSSWPDVRTVDDWYLLPDAVQHECIILHKLDPRDFANPRLMQASRDAWLIRDSNGVTVEISNEDYFHQGALIANPDRQSFHLHKSDPIQAHNICHSKTCHHFQNGKLYKCGPAALFLEFSQQFHINLSDEESEVLHGYRPGQANDSDEDLDIFLNTIKNPIDQCRFCPENYRFEEINSRAQKINFHRNRS